MQENLWRENWHKGVDYENIYLSTKLESDLQTVALEYSGLSDDLSRTYTVSSNFKPAMVVSGLCDYGSVCISKHSIGGNDGNRLHGLCVSVFCDGTANVLLEVRNEEQKINAEPVWTADIR